jgi:hypothetical protein
MEPRHLTPSAVALLGALLSGGCASTIGDAMSSMNSRYIVPTVLRAPDVAAGCATGEALGALVDSFAPYSRKAARSAIVTRVSAGMCMEAPAWEAELEGSRAYVSGDIATAVDARVRLHRFHFEAARRYAGAYAVLAAEYGVPEPDGECPRLPKAYDQLSYLLGLSAGVLAVLHDAGAAGEAGVSMSIPAYVVRGAACLDNEVWWGAPNAMKAAIWALQPDAPGAGDPWATFEQSVAKGDAAGVRLSGAFYAQTASTVGNEAELRKAIRHDANSRKEIPGAPAWRMLDEYASLLVRHESDRLWTSMTGHRTPNGELGTFPDEVPELPAGFDDLLDSLPIP